MTPRQKYLTLLAALSSIGHPLMAADTPPATATQPAKEETVTLDKVEVNDVPIEKNIMPTSRPFNSVYGTNESIMDIPRNVTIISREQLNSISIQDVRDFSKLTSSSYTRTNFGAPANPDIRGQSADVYQNGMRAMITSNGNGMPLDFNAVESVNIVKGSPTAVQGASFYNGGFVDLITKQPFFDGPHGSTYFTVGSYDKYQWGLDYGAPINNKMAYRFSYSGEESPGGYYSDQYTKTQSLYSAFTYKPSDTYTLFINASAAYMEYTENFGVNRPTQALINDHLYQTGTNINGGTVATPADPQNSANVASGFPVTNIIAPGPIVSINPHQRLLKPGDNSVARNFKFQAIQTVDLDADTKLVNNNLFTYTRRETLSSYYYSEIVDPSISLESRFEYQKSLDELSFNTGLDFKYTHVKAYNDFFFEPAAAWDITKSHAFINAYNSVNFPSFGAVPVPGYPGRFGTPDNGDSNDSYSYSGSPFVQGNYKVTNKLTAIAGARVDFLHVNTKSSLQPSTIPEVSTTVGQPSVNGSLVYKITPKLSSYFTYNYSVSASGAVANGGGYAPGTTITGLTQPSNLYELGTKASFFKDTLFIGVAAYHQTFTKPGGGGTAPASNRYEGVEFEANYQPNKNFFATFSAGYINAQADLGAGTFEALNTNLNTLYPELRSAGGGKHRVQGLPQQQYNALVSYTFDNGFGASLNGTVSSPINNNWAGTIVIPWQFQIDGSVFYTYKQWTGKVAVTNITNEFNFAPPNGAYGNESILILPGTMAQFTVTYKF